MRAVSPRSTQQVIKELEEDLQTIKTEIMNIQTGRRTSLTVYNSKIEGRYRIRDLIETSLEHLERPRPKHLTMKNPAAA